MEPFPSSVLSFSLAMKSRLKVVIYPLSMLGFAFVIGSSPATAEPSTGAGLQHSCITAQNRLIWQSKSNSSQEWMTKFLCQLRL